MLATSAFKIKRTARDDWFNAILDADTELFLDPFLVFREKRGFWRGAHDEIIHHFDIAFRLIAEGGMKVESVSYQKALHLLTFREPRELCLGYTARGTRGAGSGRGFALAIADGISNAIRRGLDHPRHFEELGILNEGIGSDRISDITCTILKRLLINYTQDIASRHNIPVKEHTVFASGFDTDRLRWVAEPVQLPTNPFNGGPFLFVPERFLRDLPVLNAEDWWTSYENQMLREDMNYQVLRGVDKKTIIATAREHPELVREWTIAKESEAVSGYDFDRDPKGVWQWDPTTDSFARSHPLTLFAPSTIEAFVVVINSILHQYKLFIEQQGGWYLLWDKQGHDKPEHAPQLLFRGIAQHYCRANNISLDAEVNLGRGPVDFKFSNGYVRRAHLEVKKLHNGKFWNGLDDQLPSYMASDQVEYGWFLAIRYRDGKAADRRARDLPNRLRNAAEKSHLHLAYVLIDARPKESASKQAQRQ